MEHLVFRPGTVILSAQGHQWTFTVRDQFDREWIDEEEHGRTWKRCTEAKSAMRRFCGLSETGHKI